MPGSWQSWVVGLWIAPGKRQSYPEKGRDSPEKGRLTASKPMIPKRNPPYKQEKTREKTLRPVDNATPEPARGHPCGVPPTACGGGSPLPRSEIRPRAGSSERLRLAAAALAASPSRGAAPAGHPRVRHVAGVQGMRACGPFSCTPTGSVGGSEGVKAEPLRGGLRPALTPSPPRPGQPAFADREGQGRAIAGEGPQAALSRPQGAAREGWRSQPVSAPFDLLRGLRDANSAKRFRQGKGLGTQGLERQTAERRARWWSRAG